jgi:hypothetical protein
MWHVWGRREMNAGLWENLKKRDHFYDLSVDGRIILKKKSQRQRMGECELGYSDSG